MARALIGLAMLWQQSSADVDPPPTMDDVPAPTVATNAFQQRLWCMEEKESQHDPTAINRRSGARGLLQWLSSTAQAWGVTVGNRASEWSAAAAIHAVSETFFVSQWPVTARLCR